MLIKQNSLISHNETAIPIIEAKSLSGLRGEFKQHFHDEYSLALVLDGFSEAWVEGIKYGVGPDSLVLIPNKFVHACNPQKLSMWKYKIVLIDPQWIHKLFNGTFWQQIIFDRPFIINHPPSAIKHLFWELIAEYKAYTEKNEIENTVTEILFLIVNFINYKISGASEYIEHTSLQRAKEYLMQNHEKDVSLDELAGVMGMSKYHLIRNFTANYGLTPHSFLINVRINNAKKLLRQGNVIIDAALKSGFYDQSHFTKTFLRYVGMTPSVYRNMH